MKMKSLKSIPFNFHKSLSLMDDASLIQKCKEYYRDELTDELFYLKLSARIKDQWLSENLSRLSKIERKHSGFWKRILDSKGLDTAKIRPNRLRVHILLLVSRIVGIPLTVKLLENGEVDAVSSYRDFSKSSISNSEITQVIEGIIKDEIEHEEVFSSAIDKSRNVIERNRSVIYGISDGLVEVLATLAGLSAIIANHTLVAMGGIVVAASGTVSMSVGAYLSKNSETQLKISEVRKKAILRNEPEPGNSVNKFKSQSRSAGLNTGLFYVLGSAIPILPFVFLQDFSALIISVILVAFTQGISNGIIALSSGIKILREALKSSILALTAALISFLIGYGFHYFLHISVI